MITATSTISEEEVVHGFTIHLKHKFRYLPIVQVLGGVMILLFFYLYFVQLYPFIPFVVLLGTGVALLLLPKLLVRAVRSSVRKSPSLDNQIEWQFSASGLKAKSDNFELEEGWIDMLEVVICDEGMIIYPAGGAMHWISANSFAKKSDFTAAAQIACDYIEKCKGV